MAEDRGGRGGHPGAVAGATPRRGEPPAYAAPGYGPNGHGPGGGLAPEVADALREEIRRVVIEELAQFAGRARG